MAYVKPQFLVQDMPLTYQMVNVIQDDLYDGWLQFSKWHGTLEPLVASIAGLQGANVGGVVVQPGLLFGGHNDKRIPRATVRVFMSSLSSGSISAPQIGTQVPGVIGGPVLRQGPGVADVRINLTEFYAECTPFGDSLGGAMRIVVPTSIYPNQGAAGGLRFTCLELDGGTTGSFVETDFDFVAHIYGTP